MARGYLKGFDEGGFAAAVDAEQAEAGAALEREGDLVQDGVAAVAEIDLFEFEQGVGQVFGRRKGETEAAVEVGGGDELEFG